LLIAVFFAITCFSCKERGGKHLNQGEIHYSIEYKGNFGQMPKEFLPKNLVVSFKDNKILFEMISSFGNSGILNLTNPEKGIFDTYFSVFTLKLFYALKPGEQFPGFEMMKDIVITKTLKTCVLCGFNCKNAQITFPAFPERVFEIWYTNEINIKNPNAATPFSQIDGVLLSFFFLLGQAELDFNAETVYKKDIPDEAFERRGKYVQVTREKIDKFINQMISL
jgi:hypothetical protein